MNSNEIIREELNSYLKSTGVSSKWIAQHCNPKIPEDILSRFKNGKRDLNEESLISLDEYLNKHKIDNI